MSTTPGARTLYELVIEKGEQRILLCYCSNRGRRTVWDVARKYSQQIISLTGTETILFAQRASDGARVGDWRIHWTGRTQREAAGSKLSWIGDKPTT